MLVTPITPELAKRVVEQRTNEWSKLKREFESSAAKLLAFEKLYVKFGRIIVPQYVASTFSPKFHEPWTVEEILAREG